MKLVEIGHGEYASQWGLTDFYEESEEKLKDVLKSGEDFDTGWFGCKKEIRYARYVREGDEFTIEVSAHMDDLWEGDDLIYDALWEVNKSEEELSDEIIDSIRELAFEGGVEDVSYGDAVILSEEATFERIVEVTDDLEKYVENNNQEMFNRLCEIVRSCVIA